MSSRADMYRRRAVDAKNRATQAKDLFIKSAFEHVAAGWVALAEQAERIDREKFPVRDEKITARSPNRARRRHLGVYPHDHGSGMRRSDVGGRETDRAPAPTWLRGNRGRLAVVDLLVDASNPVQIADIERRSKAERPSPPPRAQPSLSS
jgi:hypothetical protein